MGDKEDLTRLEDLSEYIHELNSEVDAQLEDGSKPPPPPINLDELEEEAPPFDLPDSDDIEEPDTNFEEDSAEVLDEATEPDFQLSSDDLEDTAINNDLSATTNDFTSDDEFSSDSEFSDNNEFTVDNDFSSEDDDFSNDSDFSSNDSSFASSSDFDNDESDFSNSDSDFNSESDFNNDDADFSDELSDNNNLNENNELDTLQDDNNLPSSSDDAVESHQLTNEEENLVEQQSSTATTTEQQNSEEAPTTTSIVPSNESTTTSETFQDLQNFAQNITYGKVTQGGNPPFTLMIKGIRYNEDTEDIKRILKEFGILNDDSEELINQSLERGTLFLSQLSEFVAIFLANKLRRFSGDLQLALSEQLSPAKGIDNQYKGLVTKKNLLKNIKYSADFQREQTEKNMIFITTTPNVEGFSIIKYLGVITTDLLVNQQDFMANSNEEDNKPMEDAFTLGMAPFYQQLVNQLQQECYNLGAAAAIGLTYTVTPISEHQDSEIKYKIIATASAVQLAPQEDVTSQENKRVTGSSDE